jgi:hypothetical protein
MPGKKYFSPDEPPPAMKTKNDIPAELQGNPQGST